MELERKCDGAPHWSAAVWEDVLRGSAVERVVFVAEDAAMLGFAVVSRVGDVAEVESIAVAADARRRGVARQICAEAAQWARERAATAMELEVRVGNQAALGLYAALGFVEQGRRARYYRDPVEDAVMMRMELAGDAVHT
jgi:ribosomal-protein-alanine N-acetyltransferase